MSIVQCIFQILLQHQLHTLAERDGISIDRRSPRRWRRRWPQLLTEAYLEERAQRGSRAKYEAALAQVPDVEPEPHDRLPQP